MSQRPKSIADILKTTSVRRSRPSHEDRETESSEQGKSVVQEEDYQETETIYDENSTPKSRTVSSRTKSIFSKPSEEHESSGTEDLVSRLSRLNKTNPTDHSTGERKKNTKEDPHSEESEEETHRATSRRHNSKRYDSDEDVSPPRAHRHERHRSSYGDHSDNSEESDSEQISRRKGHKKHSDKPKYDEDEYPSQNPLPLKRRISSSVTEEYQNKYKNDLSNGKGKILDNKWNKSPPRTGNSHHEKTPSHRDYSDEEYSDRKIEKPRQRQEEHDNEENPPRRSRGQHKKIQESSEESFSTLPKMAVTKIAKTVGVGSLAADVHETIKDLSGSFAYNVVSEVSKNHEIVTSAELEPIVEKYLGRAVEDLEKSDINATTFIKWLKPIIDKHQITFKKEAILYLHNTLEFYIILLFYNAKDIATRSRRSRITSKDLELASRMK